MGGAAEMLRAHFVLYSFLSQFIRNRLSIINYIFWIEWLFCIARRSEIKDVLKDIECCIGRKPEDKSCGRVPIDIDLLQWNDQILKAEDLTREYVLDGICSLLAAGEDVMNGANRKPKEPLLRINALFLHIKERTGLFPVCVIKSFLYFKLELVGCQ